MPPSNPEDSFQPVSNRVLQPHVTPPPRIAQANLVVVYQKTIELEQKAEEVLGEVTLNESLPSSGLWSIFVAGTALVEEAFLVVAALVDNVEAVSVPSSKLGPLPGVAPRINPVGDIAFISAAALRKKHTRMTRLAESSPPHILAEALASSIRHILKSVSAVEAIVAQTESFTPRLNGKSLIENSLAVRAAYSEFRLLLKTGPNMGEGAIKLQHQALQLLRKPRHAIHIRLTDKLQLNLLESRLESWLSESTKTETDTAIFSDVLTFSEMLTGVSLRQELLEYDVKTLPVVIREVAEIIADGRPLLRGHLDKVRAVDDQLELMLNSGTSLEAPAVLTQLQRVYGERARAAGMSVIELPV